MIQSLFIKQWRYNMLKNTNLLVFKLFILVLTVFLFASCGPSRKLVLVNPQFGQVQIVTETEEDEICPAVSPDGESVAYAKERRSMNDQLNFDIVVRPASGGYVETEITSTDIDEFSPDWYPDGKNIIYTVDEGNRTYLAKISAKGDHVVGELTRSGFNFNGRVSKDGNKLIFNRAEIPPTAEFRGEVIESPQLMMMDEDGFNVKFLGVGTSPAISPDGSRIAFSRQINGHWRIYHMNIDGTDIKRVETGVQDSDDIRPCWSPSGRSLVFVSNRNKVHRIEEIWKPWKIFNILFGERQLDLFKVNIDGSNLIQVTTDDRDEDWPSWGKGGAIFFQSSLRGNWDIYKINLRR